MKNCISGFVFLTAVATCMLAPDVLAQSAPRGSDGKPDFTGLWDAPPGVDYRARHSPEYAPDATAAESRFQGGEGQRMPTRRERGLPHIPLTDWGREAFLYYTAADGPDSRQAGGATDPRYHEGACGGPKSPADLGVSFLAYQTPQMLTLVALRPNNTQHPWVRKIWIGQEHPEDLSEYVPQWMGHSVGRWEDDTLVVDTVRIKEGTLIDNRAAIPQSGYLRMTERFSFDTDGSLRIDRTFDDPVAFTRPWSDSMSLVRQTDYDELRFLWAYERKLVCDPDGGYWGENDPWFDDYEELKEEALPDLERLERGLPPVPEEFRQ